MLAHTDARIINYDKLTYAGNPANLADFAENPAHLFVLGDICDGMRVRDVVNRFEIDCIANFAAETHVDRSISDAAPFVETNISGLHVLLDVARDCGVKRFLQISTDEVYGSLAEGVRADESYQLQCGSPYAASKASADLLCMAYCNTYGLPVLITRCSNNYGPYQYPEKLIPLAVTRAFAGQQIPVYGDGLHQRDWLHVNDHCAALQLVLERGRNGEIYNIGTGAQETNLEVVKTIVKLTGAKESQIEFVNDRLGHDRRYAINAAKLTEELGWKPAHSFENGLAETVEWYRGHTEWIGKIVSGEYKKYFIEQYSETEL